MFLDQAAKAAVEAFREDPGAPAGAERVTTYRQQALGYFGQYLHAIQDFYAHSNWIELQVAQNVVPPLAPIQYGCDSSTLPNGLTTGYFDVWSPFDFCGPTNAPAGAQPPPRPPARSGFTLCHGPADHIKLPDVPKLPENDGTWSGAIGSFINTKVDTAKTLLETSAQGLQANASTLPASLMLAKDVPDKYHGEGKLTLPDGRGTTYHAEAMRLATAATAAPETWAAFHDQVVEELKWGVPDRDPECLFQVLIKGGDPTCATQLYAGAITNAENFWSQSVMRSSWIEISLDPASSSITGGELSYQLDETHIVDLTGIEVTDLRSFESTQPATGTSASFPDGAGGTVTFIGTLTVQYGRFAERNFTFPPSDPVNGIDVRPNAEQFGFVIDETGELMLCRASAQLTMSPDAQTRQRECASKAFAILTK
jgi:hypothetical protein